MNIMKKRIIQIGILVLGIGLCIYGAVNGDTELVIRKAVTVCLECIGIG